MSDWHLDTPVVFIIFNRPECAERVLARIAAARPRKLFVIGDGPRASWPGEEARVACARALIGRVDWECEVTTILSDVNLGCRRRVSSGLDRVFSEVEAAIILEDDCLPDPSFFRFAEELLLKYADDERVFAVSGDNFQRDRRSRQESYYFSKYVHVWGWATWRRSWARYDVSLAMWPELRRAGWLEQYLPPAEVGYWTKAFDSVIRQEVDSWAHQMTFACWNQNALNILPAANLVSNIGFGPAATNTTGSSRYADLPVTQMSFPLRHPALIVQDSEADAHTHTAVLQPPPLARVVARFRDALRRVRV